MTQSGCLVQPRVSSVTRLEDMHAHWLQGSYMAYYCFSSYSYSILSRYVAASGFCFYKSHALQFSYISVIYSLCKHILKIETTPGDMIYLKPVETVCFKLNRSHKVRPLQFIFAILRCPSYRCSSTNKKTDIVCLTMCPAMRFVVLLCIRLKLGRIVGNGSPRFVVNLLKRPHQRSKFIQRSICLEMPYGYQIWQEEPLIEVKCIAGIEGHPGSTRDQIAQECPLWVQNLVGRTPDRSVMHWWGQRSCRGQPGSTRGKIAENALRPPNLVVRTLDQSLMHCWVQRSCRGQLRSTTGQIDLEQKIKINWQKHNCLFCYREAIVALELMQLQALQY